MSCTVVALPVAIAYAISALAGVGTVLVNNINEQHNESLDFDNDINSTYSSDISAISQTQFIEKCFDTPFTDREVLLKTLEEHGLNDIQDSNGTITGSIENYKLKFEQKGQEQPYHLTIICPEDNDTEEKVADISSEYTLNVQEQSYLSIVENLKQNNMEIEEEEVLEDNTIVLTINLE